MSSQQIIHFSPWSFSYGGSPQVKGVFTHSAHRWRGLRHHAGEFRFHWSIERDYCDLAEITDAKDGSLIYVLKEEGYVAVIKATRTSKAVFMTSFRRLSSRAAQRDGEVRRLLLKAVPKTKK
jgi:hypothetical protein